MSATSGGPSTWPTEPDLNLPPIVDLVEHGERGLELDTEHPWACLCGRWSNYLCCPEPGIESVTLYPVRNTREVSS